MRTVALGLQGPLRVVAPDAGADDGTPAHVRFLMLDRVLARLTEARQGEELTFLFLVTEQIPASDTDTHHLRRALEKWAEHRKVTPHIEPVAWAVEIDQQLPFLTELFERLLAGGGPVTVVLGPGTPQLNMASFLATFSGIEASDAVEVLQVRATLGPGGRLIDSVCVLLAFPGMVGRRMARTHAARRLENWELADACLLVGTLAGFDEEEFQMARRMSAYLLRQPPAPGPGPATTPASDAAAHCLDLVECMWERRDREGWSVVFHLALLVNELVPAAWLEHWTGAPYDDNTGGAATLAATARLRDGLTLEALRKQLFVLDTGSQVYSPGRLVLTAMAPTAGRRARGDPPAISWPLSPQLVDQCGSAEQAAAVRWIAAYDALCELRNRYAHTFETTDPGALEAFIRDLSSTVPKLARVRWLDREAGEVAERRRLAAEFIEKATGAGSKPALCDALASLTDPPLPAAAKVFDGLRTWTASLLDRDNRADLGPGGFALAMRSSATTQAYDPARLDKLLAAAAGAADDSTRTEVPRWHPTSFGLVVEAHERGVVTEDQVAALVSFLNTGDRPADPAITCVVGAIPTDCLLPAMVSGGSSPLRQFLGGIVPDLADRTNWLARRRTELLDKLRTA
ncbi:MAG: hypothetical protein ACRD0Q_01665, partial [Acidimicrobiales bacterium]